MPPSLGCYGRSYPCGLRQEIMDGLFVPPTSLVPEMLYDT